MHRFIIIGWASLALLARPSAAQDAATCIEDHERAIAAETTGALRDARDGYAACAASACPAEVRSECLERAAATLAAIPSIVLAVTDADGRDVTDAQVLLNGTALPSALDGRPIPLDPGRHRVEVKTGAGRRTLSFVARQGEKNRVLTLRLKPVRERLVEPDPPLIHPAAWVAGAIGVAGLAVFAVAGGLGYDKQQSLEDCRPGCSQGDVDIMRDRYLAADIGLLTGGLGLAAAVTLGFALAPDSTWTVEASAGSARITGRF